MNQQKTYDRAAEDIGNSIHLEHVNVQIPDQRLSMLFYGVGLGLTRDPYLMVHDRNMWINVGRSQFHLPTGNPQVLRGHTGLVISGREALLERLTSVRKRLEGTRFGFSEFSRRSGDFAIAMALVVLGAEPRVGIGGVEPRPRCISTPAEKMEEHALRVVDPMTDQHYSAAYRRDLVRAVVRRALEQACA